MKMYLPKKRGGTFRLWLPLFLAYPLILALGIALAPLVLLLALLTWPVGWGKTFLLLGPALTRLVFNLRGLMVDIESKKDKVLISFE